MTAISYLYQKLSLLKLPVITLLLIVLWVGVSLFVVIVDINNQHKNLISFYEFNRVQQNAVIKITKNNISLTALGSKDILNKQIQEIQNLKEQATLIRSGANFDRLTPRFKADRVKLERILDNNITKTQLQICQGDKINEINQFLVEVSKVEIKPYTKAIIGQLESSFGQVSTNLAKAIDINNQLIRCLSNSGSAFVSQDNYYSLIRFGKYLSGVNKIYNRIIETLKAEDRTGLDAGLNLIKAIDINNFVTLKPGFFSELEKNKNQILEKNLLDLTLREERIKDLQAKLKNNLIINFDR